MLQCAAWSSLCRLQDFTVKWSDVADGVPEAGKRGSATLFVKLKVHDG